MVSSRCECYIFWARICCGDTRKRWDATATAKRLWTYFPHNKLGVVIFADGSKWSATRAHRSMQMFILCNAMRQSDLKEKLGLKKYYFRARCLLRRTWVMVTYRGVLLYSWKAMRECDIHAEPPPLVAWSIPVIYQILIWFRCQIEFPRSKWNCNFYLRRTSVAFLALTLALPLSLGRGHLIIRYSYKSDLKKYCNWWKAH